LPFQKQWEDLDMMLVSIQETLLIKKVNSILIQVASLFDDENTSNTSNDYDAKM
jgi:hypothetical protein